MGLMDQFFGSDSPPEEEPAPRKPTLYDEQIPNTFNLGWYYSENKNQYQMAKITNDDRNSHFYVIGGTGVGKTKFIEYLIMQDILNGRGVGVIDPHGDLIEDLKGLLAVGCKGKTSKDVLANYIVIIDPTDPTYTVAFNPLERLPGVSAAEQANELISSFKKIWADSWGVRMEDLMRNSLIALAEADFTLVELSLFLTDRRFRETVLEKVKNPIALEYFGRFNTLSDRGAISWIEPITNKINAVFSDERVKDMFSSAKSTFNVREVMDQGKVLLIKLDKGRLKDAANLLGSLLLAKIQMAAFSRSDVSPKQRVPFYLYIDEFQNFASESFAIILSEARKYGLYVTIAHQSLSQISPELRDLIISCAGIQVYFRLGRQDAQFLSKEAFQYTGSWEEGISELQSLPLRVCYVKNKIQGGIIHINAVPIEQPHEILKVDESKFQKHLDFLPFGKSYLVERKDLVSLASERRKQITKEIGEKPKRLVAQTEQTVARATAEVKPPQKSVPKPKYEPVPIKVEVKEPVSALPVMTAREEDKGTTRHQYLQSLIKNMAEEKGYRAIIEQPTPDGLGRVDVGLEREGKKFACEISVTTTAEHELSNIEKCLNAGYDKVIMCSQDKRHLEKIRAFVMEKLKDSGIEKVMFFEPEELLFYFEEESAQSLSKEERIKGYKVKVNYQPIGTTEKNIKREAVAQVILGAFRRLKGNN